MILIYCCYGKAVGTIRGPKLTDNQTGQETQLIPNLIGILDRKELIHIRLFHTMELYEGYSWSPSFTDVPSLLPLIETDRQFLTGLLKVW